jgi:hypothetical protein
MRDPHILSIAYHEAGHAVAALVQGCPVTGCTLDPEGVGELKFPAFDAEGADPATLRKYAIIALSGWEAQLHQEPDLSVALFASSIECDMRSARECVGRAVAGEAERRATLAAWQAEACLLVAAHWRAIEAIGNALVVRHALTGEEIKAIFHESTRA